VIFVDVGAHDGQTLEEVVKPRHGFDVIYAFEPMPDQYRTLRERFSDDPRVRLLNAGLADDVGARILYGDNSQMDATLYPTKRDIPDPSFQTKCLFVRASTFFLALPAEETVVVKLNCEGAEVLILNDLIESGTIWRIHEAMIDFDIRKVDGHEHEEQEILDRLGDIGFTRYVLSEDVMSGETHQDRIANWLDGIAERRA